MWVFLSILVTCIAVIAYKFIDESCSIDMWIIDRRFDEIKQCLREIYKLLEEGGKE